MEKDLIFGLISNSRYPMIYRHDRTIYQQYPSLDPLNLASKCTLLAFAGYWIGKYFKKREILFAVLLPFPLIIQYLYQQAKVSSSGRMYDSLKISERFVSQLKAKPKQLQPSSDGVRQSSFKTIRKMPNLQSKIYNASDFISQLPPEYFK